MSPVLHRPIICNFIGITIERFKYRNVSKNIMGRMKNNLGRIREELEGYNLRERANIYAGATLGFLAQIFACRYLALPKTDNTIDEAIAWSASIVTNIGF